MVLLGLVLAMLEVGLQANPGDVPTGFSVTVVFELHGTVGTGDKEEPEPIASSKLQRLPRFNTARRLGKWLPKFLNLVGEEPPKNPANQRHHYRPI